MRALFQFGIFASSLLAVPFVQGCASHTGSSPPPGISRELAQAWEQADTQRVQIAVLEARIARLEHESEAAMTRQALLGANQARELEHKIEQLVELNQCKLNLETPTVQPVATRGPWLDNVTSLPEPMLGDGQTQRQQLRELLEKVYGTSMNWRDGLSRGQNEALRVLLRPDRQLDSQNPLREW